MEVCGMATRIRQFLVELLIIHVVWNLAILGIWVLMIWLDRGAGHNRQLPGVPGNRHQGVAESDSARI